jgi:oligogalacturonide lyase
MSPGPHGKGAVRRLDFATRCDPDTGARVTRLTPPDITCHRNYFYQKCFTRDGTRLIFGAGFGPGPHWHYHLLDLAAGTATQLSEGERVNTFGGFLSPDDRWLYFVRAERELIRLELAGLREERAYAVPAGWVGYGTWVANSACTQMVGIEIHADDWFELDDWAKFAALFHARPRCRLIRIDLASGARELVLEQRGWLGHPQFRPGHDDTIAYCHEGPHELIDARIWFIDADGRHRRCAKVHAPGESCTHEFWLPDGAAMVYVSFQRDGAAGTNGTNGAHRLCRLDPLTLQSSVLAELPPCAHLMSNQDGSLMVGDGRGSDPYLHLFDLRSGRQRRLARHDSSWRVHQGQRQATHPHPSFTPDDRAVLYTSDAEGAPALFLAELAGR